MNPVTPRDLFDLTRKTAVVTGGAGLLGRAIVQRLADYGATVYVADLDIKAAKAVCAHLPATLASSLRGVRHSTLADDEAILKSQIASPAGKDRRARNDGLSGILKPIALDITKPVSIRSVIRKILADTGRIDIWVNCAYPRTKDWGNVFEKIKPASWKKNIDEHLNGYCFSCQAVAERMKEQKGGSIINMASVYGIKGPDFSIYENSELTMPAAYSVIKGGLINFTRYLACYYGKYGVRVNAISPGGVADNQPKRFVKKYSAKTLLGRMAVPDDIAYAVLYLASDASSYVTGHNLVVDGGFTVS